MSVVLIRLTGQIGAGKSTVSSMLRERGIKTMDADQIVRDEQTRGTLGYTAIVQQFGAEILNAEKEIDRAKLGALVFGDPARLKQLEDIMHPRVAARTLEARSMLEDGEILVVEAIKNSSWTFSLYDEIWVVVAPRDLQVRRLRDSRGMSEGEANARLASQMSEAEYRALAKVVFENDGDRTALARQVDAALAGLRERIASGAVRGR
ncbi:MAG: dephospho-CoA kinase [Chloroflexi bacterium]|nr:dephospho-CoA kinase [Chloroflexota bacterium]